MRPPGGERPLRLLHLSDLHASWAISLEFSQEAINLGLREKPDLICVTGDFITTQYSAFDAYARLLAQLPAAAPTFACLGNHDGGTWAGEHGGYKTTVPVGEMLKQSGIEVLRNRWTSIRLQDREIKLIGLPDIWSEGVNPARAFPAPNRADPALRIVLSHNPDTKDDFRPFQWDLLLSGHTHGGQVVLPLLGTPFAPVKDKRFIAGLYSWENRWIHITKGVGNVHGLRLNCPPEISILTLL